MKYLNKLNYLSLENSVNYNLLDSPSFIRIAHPVVLLATVWIQLVGGPSTGPVGYQDIVV